MKRILLGMAAALILDSAAFAGPYEDGLVAHSSGNYAASVAHFSRGAEQGDARAEYRLGSMYRFGNGVPQDYAEAFRWFRKAAEQGNADAQGSLGSMYYGGRGVSQDYAEAFRWFRKAAEQGDAGAQILLGGMYSTGEGVPLNNVLALMWLDLAAAQAGLDKGQLQKSIEKRMTPEEIAEAQHLARNWKPVSGLPQEGGVRTANPTKLPTTKNRTLDNELGSLDDF